MYRAAVLFYCFSFSAGLRLDSLAPNHPMGKLVVCTQVRDEVPYLFEWIAFHRTLGVDQFDIYNDGSSDGLERLPEMYSAAGKPYVNVFQAKAHGTSQGQRHGAQFASFNDCLARHHDAAWVGIFDVDEFVSLQDKSPKGSEDSCEGLPRLKCFLSGYMKRGFSEVSLPPVRFSSNKQIWRQPNPIKSTKGSEIQLAAKTLPLNCTDLLLTSSKQPEDVCRGGALPTIIGSHIFRGPKLDITSDSSEITKEEIEKKYPMCADKKMTKEFGYNVCMHGKVKSFIRPQFCKRYEVHSCSEKKKALKRLKVHPDKARLNHYYTRSAEDVCKHAAAENLKAPIGVYKYADDSFFLAIKDPLIDEVSQAQLQDEMFSVMCQAHGK